MEELTIFAVLTAFEIKDFVMDYFMPIAGLVAVGYLIYGRVKANKTKGE